MSNERVVKLLRSHRVRIARALVRQSRALAPRYEQVDQAAQERNFLALLLAVERLLESNDEKPLLDAASYTAQLRASMGFRLEDFVAAAVGFLPVLRRFIIEHASNVEEGLDDYEAFEAVGLPFIARAAAIFVDAAEDPTMPNQAKLAHAKTRESGRLTPIRVERVTGTEDEEETYRNHPLFSSIG
jgi:hypothetical protein